MSNDNALGSPGSDKEWKEHFEAQEVVITGHKLAEKPAYHCPKCDSWFSEVEALGEAQ